MNHLQMTTAIENLLNGADYATGGDFKKNGLQWEAERCPAGQVVVNVWIGRRFNREASIYAGGLNSPEIQRDRFAALVAPALKCRAELGAVLAALAAL